MFGYAGDMTDKTPILRADALDDDLQHEEEPKLRLKDRIAATDAETAVKRVELCPYCALAFGTCGHPTGVAPMIAEAEQ